MRQINLSNRIVILTIVFLFLVVSAQAATFTVQKTTDESDMSPGNGICFTVTGDCTLRAAIEEANAFPGLDTINFAILGAGVKTFVPASSYPNITEAVTIDGLTQGGVGYTGSPLIELNGMNAGAASGLTAVSLSVSSTFHGLTINRFSGNGIYFSNTSNSVITNCYIGTDATGTVSLGNGLGVFIGGGFNRIGGVTPPQRNIISGNTGVGIFIDGAATTGNNIQGNYIGTNVGGTAVLANQTGVLISGGAFGNIIGGDSSSKRNVISGNTAEGAALISAGGSNVVSGNYIGTDAGGTLGLGNGGAGVKIFNSSTGIIGGSIAGEQNVISGNTGDGVLIFDADANSVIGNYIGTGANGIADLGNSGAGVNVDDSSDCDIGGITAGKGNLIAFNSIGVKIFDLNATTVANGNKIRGNSIFSNDNLGIDLAPLTGVTANDTDDPDGGANNKQNYPVLTNASSASGITTIDGSLNSTVSTQFRLDFYSSAACDSSGSGEGEIYLGAKTVTTDAGGDVAFSYTPGASVAVGRSITATATRVIAPTDTSEFSVCFQVVNGSLPKVVTNTLDSGAGSLRQAMTDANAAFGPDTITFNIPNGGIHTINLLSALPIISDQIIIDGATQPGYAGAPLIELNGLSAGVLTSGLNITAGNSLVRALIINRFTDKAILLQTGGGNTIEGCYIGTDATGTIARINKIGIGIFSSANNLIGGATAAQRNIISGNNGTVSASFPNGNGGQGIWIDGAAATDNIVSGNYIGTNAGGTAAMTNGTGVYLSTGATGNIIGGTTAGERNVISGNTGGIALFGANGNIVVGNYIGTDASGTLDLGNVDGITLLATNNRIGGTTAGERNIISGNNTGVSVTSSDNIITGNYIGTDVGGTLDLGNGFAGVSVASSSNNQIGGTFAGESNIIAFNAYGITVSQFNGATTEGNQIRRNSIFSNATLGIDLAANGVTANDADDADTGPNRLQNFPVISSATNSSGSTNIQGSLDSTASTTFKIEFFTNNVCSASGSGEGKTFIGSRTITTDANGDAPINVSFATQVAFGLHITTTATRDAAPFDTSEFSECIQISGNNPPIVINTLDAGAGSLRQAITNANANPGLDTITFNIPGAGVHTINLLTALPFITDAVIINGATQPGYAGLPLIEINGDATNASLADGLRITGGGSTVRGLIINNFNGDGIVLTSGGNNVITNCFIGTDSTGTTSPLSFGNADNGILVESSFNRIGGASASMRNVISGNSDNGIRISGGAATDNIITGNTIGLDVSRTIDLGNNLSGIEISLASNNRVGGATAGERNVISGNTQTGVKLITAVNNFVKGNYIGTDGAGAADLGNSFSGVEIGSSSSGNIIGGTTSGERNVISGNNQSGVKITSSAINNQVKGNFIGTDSAGTADLGNTLYGVEVNGNANTNIIGGIAGGEANRIAFNSYGVRVGFSTEVGNSIRGNSIFSNDNTGIDLIDPILVNPNDTDDPDTGGNNLQNYPVLTSVFQDGGSTLIEGSLNSTPNTTFNLDFYANSACDASGNGEGENFLGSRTVTTDAGGDVVFNFSIESSGVVGQFLSATATRNAAPLDTSEFSQCAAIVAAPGNLSFAAATFTANENAGTKTIAVTRTGGNGTITVQYVTSNGTATAGVDYTATSGTLTFLNGENLKTFNIAITNDTLDEANETVNLTLSNPTSGVILTPFATAVLTINDNDNPPQISITDVALAEGNGGTTNFIFNVNLSAPSGLDVYIDYATANGTATSGSDYTSTGGTLVFSAASAETVKTVTVAVNSDFVTEINETFFVNLTNPINTTFGDNQGLGTIVDDDNPGRFSFTLTPYSGVENTQVLVTVSRTNGTAGTVSVDYATSGGSATPSSDYAPVAGTLLFGDGETVKTFTVNILDDALVEPTENFNVVLSNPIGGASLGSPAVAAVNILDNDSGTLLTISGEILKTDNTPLIGATVNLTGAQTGTTTTNNLGRYAFTNLAPNGNYSVTPSALGFTFNPISRQYNNLSVNVTNANFTVTAAPVRQLRIVGGNATPTQNITAKIELVAQGDENSAGFSLDYDAAILMNPTAVLGADAAGGFITVNPSAAGKVGILLALPAGQTFAAGTRQIVTVTFNTLPTIVYNSPITFGNIPIVKEVSNANADALPTVYLDGMVTFAQGWEADVAPRPTGNNTGSITISDFTQTGRFVAGLDTLNANFNEFQRADSAPRISLGNGSLTVSDYTQAGRYAAGLDVPSLTGGQYAPRFAQTNSIEKNLKNSLFVPTIVRVVNAQASASSQVTVSLETVAQGTENGFGFTLNYDPAKLSNPLVSIGSGIPNGSTLIPNTLQAGRVGVILGLPFGTGLTAGTKQLVTVRFDVAANAAAGNTALFFNDVPVVREVSDLNANVLPSTFQDGAINILGPTAADVTIAGRVLTANNRGVSGARVVMTDASGIGREARTNSFGYYNFTAVAAGETYIFTVTHKRFEFAPQVVFVIEERDDFNFVSSSKSSFGAGF